MKNANTVKEKKGLKIPRQQVKGICNIEAFNPNIGLDMPSIS